MSKYCSGNGKRQLLEVTNKLYPSPPKKQRQNLNKIAIQDEISRFMQTFSVDKLKANREYSENAANDALFHQQETTKKSSQIRWVLACKFIIASQLRFFNQYDVLGMHRNKIPQNMYFYVDDQKNLCALIKHNKNDKKDTISQKIIEHCNKIETSMIQTYIAGTTSSNNNDNMMIDEDEDDDLWLDMKQTKINENHDCHHAENKEINDEIISIIRVPMSYYNLNIESSFYEICCKIVKYMVNNHDYGNPLFQLLLKNIANFDSFQSSVPMVPLNGSLYQMFCQFGLGLYQINDNDDDRNINKNSMNKKEFIAFLGVFEVCKEIKYKENCRKSMYQYWTKHTETDINIMNIVIEYCDFNEMTDEKILDFVDKFNTNSRNYSLLLKQLKDKIPHLESIVNFESKW